LGVVLRIKLTMMGIALLSVLAGGSAQAGGAETVSQQSGTDWLGLAAGPAAAAETLLAADMASLFGAGEALRILPMLGDAGEATSLISTSPLSRPMPSLRPRLHARTSRSILSWSRGFIRKRSTLSPAPISGPCQISPARK
jgi:hypothetical protein